MILDMSNSYLDISEKIKTLHSLKKDKQNAILQFLKDKTW